MPTTPHTAQATASPSTLNRSSMATPSTQDHEKAFALPAASNASSNALLSDSDDDLSDAPESPIDPEELPTSPISSSLPHNAPPADSDSDLSDAPDSPVCPEGSKAPSLPPHCTEKDCPIKQALRRHYQGPYLHKGELPRTKETIFGASNPPPHVWESWTKIQASDSSSTVDDDWNVLGFLRWHVGSPNTSLMGI